ncbi:MAG TPA: polyprenyl synthetase family protein [Bryobacteraceae bacterium]|nr:polyprenyl synthetase family protein [Bryobacteraceae bacterium]
MTSRAPITAIDEDVAQFLEDVDRHLRPYMAQACALAPDIEPLKKGLSFQIASGGKRIRAALCVTSSELFGADFREALHFAAAIEHLQNFSLIHDDIADGDTHRRLRESIWRQFGIAHGINIGDVFIPLASMAILEAPYPERLKIALLRTVSTYGIEMVAGQAMDINMRRKNFVTVRDYMTCTEKKTGAFLAMATVGGGMIGRASERQLQALHEFAMLAGTAFQIKDDILDIEGRKGRDTGSDILEGKRTLLVIHAARRASDGDARRLFEILNKDRADKTPEEVRWACNLLRITRSIDYAERTASELADNAARHLLALPDNEAKYRLLRISKYLSSRMR